MVRASPHVSARDRNKNVIFFLLTVIIFPLYSVPDSGAERSLFPFLAISSTNISDQGPGEELFSFFCMISVSGHFCNMMKEEKSMYSVDMQGAHNLYAGQQFSKNNVALSHEISFVS